MAEKLNFVDFKGVSQKISIGILVALNIGEKSV
jgi:hypothetical protein